MSETAHRRSLGLLLGSVGIVFAASGLTLWFAWIRPRTADLNQAVFGIVVHVVFGYIVVMSAIVLLRSDPPAMEYRLATKWCLGGAAFTGALVLWGAIPELTSGAIALDTLREFVVVGSAGAAAGVLVGLHRGRAARNRRLADRTADREETLVFLLRLLEHDIRNHMVAISNHADSIRPSTFDPSPTPAEAIGERTASIEQLLDTANVVLESETDGGEFERVDIGCVLREEIAVIRSDAPDVSIDADIGDDLHVESDRFVGEVFRNVLENAVVHNPPADLTVSVTATAADGAIEIEIADDGDGIPPDVRGRLFEPGVHDPDSSGDGIGLYLVGKLVDAYGGRVTVSDRSPTGTRFRFRFPSAPPDADGAR
ncbi:histidine kinase [Natronomonas moolapensis 8.8.11]|uniref:histidine kinase n=1 Tax=Natronomonas moolapensis (strain DSM 18674 / CECT 7526 / JCM 14361 / 8.8.11) TaxID=268739 RepID=M1XQJ6_NATM8|nr:HAMP domain-containing sensor histidine kinase [Natronomonas moolapensis]CCQ36372.1 histidine kinase [Natronomonas moolapensis 8.8.11]